MISQGKDNVIQIAIDNESKTGITDEEVRAIIKEECQIKNAKDLQGFDTITRNKFLKKLKEKYNLATRQLKDLRQLIKELF
jgi:hypothetical protein